MKLLITDSKSKYLSEKGSKLYVQEGVIDLKGAVPGGIVETHLGKKYHVLGAELLDLLPSAKRGPQVILPKDVGAILAHTNIDKNSICIDAGTGSGWLSVQLSRFVKKIYTYEIRPEHLKIARENFGAFEIKNIVSKEGDASEGFDEKNADLIILDMLNPEKVPFAKSLRLGGYCVAYVPHIEQAQQFISALPENIIFDKILDAREENFNPSGTRVRSKIRHTGFLVFVRKV